EDTLEPKVKGPPEIVRLVVAPVATDNPVKTPGVCGAPLIAQFTVTAVSVAVPKLVTVTVTLEDDVGQNAPVGVTHAVTPASLVRGVTWAAPMSGGVRGVALLMSVVIPAIVAPAPSSAAADGVIGVSELPNSGSVETEFASLPADVVRHCTMPWARVMVVAFH